MLILTHHAAVLCEQFKKYTDYNFVFNVTLTQIGHFVTGCPGRETCSGG